MHETTVECRWSDGQLRIVHLSLSQRYTLAEAATVQFHMRCSPRSVRHCATYAADVPIAILLSLSKLALSAMPLQRCTAMAMASTR